MSKLLKNKEVRRTLFWQFVVSVIACAVCYYIDIRAGQITTALSLLLILIYYISTYKRYRRIASLAGDINKLLHGDNAISLENYSEGELGILHSEIYKMTIRLREQQAVFIITHTKMLFMSMEIGTDRLRMLTLRHMN